MLIQVILQLSLRRLLEAQRGVNRAVNNHKLRIRGGQYPTLLATLVLIEVNELS